MNHLSNHAPWRANSHRSVRRKLVHLIGYCRQELPKVSSKQVTLLTNMGEHSPRRVQIAEVRPPIVSHNVDSHVGSVPAAAIPIGGPRTIQPQLEPIRSHNILPNAPLEVRIEKFSA